MHETNAVYGVNFMCSDNTLMPDARQSAVTTVPAVDFPETENRITTKVCICSTGTLHICRNKPRKMAPHLFNRGSAPLSDSHPRRRLHYVFRLGGADQSTYVEMLVL